MADNKDNQIEPQPTINQQIHTKSKQNNESTKSKQQTKDWTNESEKENENDNSQHDTEKGKKIGL